MSPRHVPLTDVEATVRDYEFEDLGWVYCQGGGYFGGFDDGLGQGVYRGDEHFEGEVWDVSHPTTIVDASGRSFEFEHDWAESFTLLRHAGHDRPRALRVRPHRRRRSDLLDVRL